MPLSEELLDRLDALLDVAADEIEGVLLRELSTLTAAAEDYTANDALLAPNPSDEEVAEVESRTTEAAVLAGIIMLMLMGLNENDAFTIMLGVPRPGSLSPSAIRHRLATLRSIVNTRVRDSYADSIRKGLTPQEALAKAIESVRNSVALTAEAEALAAVNTGINVLGGALSAEGMVITKTWYTRRDNRVRETHVRMEGVEVPYRSTFSVGGWPMEYPGDTRVPPALWANCRCIMILGSSSVLSAELSLS